MIFFILFFVLFMQTDLLLTASFNANHFNTRQSTKMGPPSIFDSMESDEQNTEATNDFAEEEGDAFYNQVKKKVSFKTKLLRAIRTAKRNSTVIIGSLCACGVVYAYWYSLWPFAALSKTKQPEQSAQSNTPDGNQDLVLVNDIKDEPTVLPPVEQGQQKNTATVDEPKKTNTNQNNLNISLMDLDKKMIKISPNDDKEITDAIAKIRSLKITSQESTPKT